MTHAPLPARHATQHIAGDWHVLPVWLPVRGLGALTVNAFLLTGPEPMAAARPMRSPPKTAAHVEAILA